MFREGEFNTIGGNMTVFISHHEEDGSVAGILVHDEKNPEKKIAFFLGETELFSCHEGSESLE